MTPTPRHISPAMRIGIDNSEELLKKNPYKTIKSDAEQLPFKDKEFDFITCVTAIHNFTNNKKALDEMNRVIKEKGKIVITILKKAKNFNEIKKNIKEKFNVIKEVNESKDKIIFLNKKTT